MSNKDMVVRLAVGIINVMVCVYAHHCVGEVMSGDINSTQQTSITIIK
jgi:hypothetical protein